MLDVTVIDIVPVCPKWIEHVSSAVVVDCIEDVDTKLFDPRSFHPMATFDRSRLTGWASIVFTLLKVHTDAIILLIDNGRLPSFLHWNAG